MIGFPRAIAVLLLSLLAENLAIAQLAGQQSSNPLTIVQSGHSTAVILIDPSSSEMEKLAAADLQDAIEKMTGAKVKVLSDALENQNALASSQPLLIVGQLALSLDPTLQESLGTVQKPRPVLRSDAIVLRRTTNRVYLAGNNPEAHAYAVSELLHRWGCRWYLPTEIGECIPEFQELSVGELEYAYASPFEVRRYWLSWLGDNSGKAEFMRQNRFNDLSVPNGHILGQYTKELIPPGKSMFNVPISEDQTAEHVANQVLANFKAGNDVQLGMEDGLYESDSPQDKELIALQYDKYFQTQSYTDAFMVFYNKVARILQDKAPESNARIGFLAYSNITLPPLRVDKAAKPLVAYLAPIDFDPIHSMDDPRSAPRRELKEILYRWAQIMEGRVVIYDYDQSMLVWRDIPNPSHQAFAKDVQHYRKAGILGVDTESRGATATTFLNLYFRGQFLWNPDANVETLLEEFYPKFYGPAAKPMQEYWSAIYRAWDSTLATEHEYFVAPSIYTPELIATLKDKLQIAEQLISPLSAKQDRNSKLYVQRIRFTRLQFSLIEAYMAMIQAANTDADYQAAVAHGKRGLEIREQLTEMNPTFTTYKKIGESGYAWWPGEVQQYQELVPWTDGSKGTRIANLPLVCSFRTDPANQGLEQSWQTKAIDASWRTLRTDLYAQAQGIVTEDYQSYTGHLWYDTQIELTAEQIQGPIHLRFPGIFNECWLYVDGIEVAHRPFKGLWWLNDYRFEWDVDLTGKLKLGKNRLTVRLYNPHHFGGMFRRPFLYRVTQ
ncbi:MAG: DUF4838 domain-containing protein [Pirellula sp.]